ncbi:glutathione S-transferase [Vibrio palustris]|uniref:Glutathione S-transferase YfcF n=1 Tax=Vibrio palustris TaxID=1918946 RepID=A0A1R4B5L3_9VIBR|nr:glutathione S-transferase [Vibrio palustris]SJL84222.1 Glutathione S-transferase YfcF [Vibrio palustris]
MKLFIANQNYSTWSLRAWYLTQRFNLNVNIHKLPLFSTEFYTTLNPFAANNKVPLLVDHDQPIWGSLAIMEYLNDAYLDNQAWPANRLERAKARAISGEMQSEFTALRSEMPMNCRAKRHLVLSDAAQRDIARIDALWSEQMAQYPQQWLFGEWSIADAMFAPVALRFMTYGIELSPAAAQYQQRLINDKMMQRWLQEALQETEIVDEDEAGIDIA